jgi:hypothetical protein
VQLSGWLFSFGSGFVLSVLCVVSIPEDGKTKYLFIDWLAAINYDVK